MTFEELENDYIMYGFPESALTECNDNPYNFRSNNYVSGELVFAVLDIINLLNVFGDKNRLALFIRGDLVLVVSVKDFDNSIRKTFDMVISYYKDETSKKMGGISIDSYGQESRIILTYPEKFLYHFLDKLISDDRKFLENMEHNMSLLEDEILSGSADSDFINDILSIKKELMYIWNYYDQLIDFGEILRDNETGMFPQENIRGFEVFTKRVTRLSENVKQLKEYTVQLQETHDAMMSYNLNNIMKIFTVVTAVFLPLSLIAGWYGMNFEGMPELKWKYGYPCVVMLSALVAALCFSIFKIKKLI